jgi:hypothetical protein
MQQLQKGQFRPSSLVLNHVLTNHIELPSEILETDRSDCDDDPIDCLRKISIQHMDRHN